MLTTEQHRDVLARLVAHARHVGEVEIAVSEYSSLMVAFLMHQLGSATAVLALLQSFGQEWFPVTAAYPIARTMLEVDVTAHYIGQDPDVRARRYIEFGHVLKKRRMDTCSKHRSSSDASWREGMALEWQHQWAGVESVVNAQYERVRSSFASVNSKGQTRFSTNWAGKTLYEMAREVNHSESYDLFYADLSSFTHGDVRLADRFLRVSESTATRTQRAHEDDVGAVLRFAATFLTCFLELFGTESKLWSGEAVRSC